jgi:hypothetical protein
MMKVMTAPARAERNMTIARDASNLQKRKDMPTGAAFWTEKAATHSMIMHATSMMPIDPPFRTFLSDNDLLSVHLNTAVCI